MKKILLLLLINLLGFASIGFIGVLAIKLDLIPALPDDMLYLFHNRFFGGMMIIWLVSAILSLGFLGGKHLLCYILFFLPFVLPALYGLFILGSY